MRRGISIGRQLTLAVLLTTVLCLGSVLSPSVANATAYYVATTGNNGNSCSTATNPNGSAPRRTIAQGIACLSAGDTLYIRQGTYVEQLRNWDGSVTFPAGTDWGSGVITIASYPGETATLQGGIDMHETNSNNGVAPQYLIFDRLVIDGAGNPNSTANSGFNLVYLRTSHIRFSNSDIGNVNNDIMQLNLGAVDVQFINNKIHDAYVNFNNQPWPQCGNQPCTLGGYGIYFGAASSLVDGNTFYNCTGYALHFYSNGSTGVQNNVVRNNIFYNNYIDDGQRGNSGSTIVLSTGGNSLVYNNIIYNTPSAKHIYAIEEHDNDQIYNNTIYNNHGIGIFLYPGSSGVIVQNNLIYANERDDVVDQGSGGGIITNNLVGVNPQFVNAPAGDFSLNAGSPAIDAGVMVSAVTTDIKGISRPQGAAYDIGAYEFTGSPPLPAPTNLRIVTVSP